MANMEDSMSKKCLIETKDMIINGFKHSSTDLKVCFKAIC